MKLNILGNGSIGAKYMSASAIIDNHILIDAPNGIVKHLKSLGYLIENIDMIFITHLHGDHFSDLPFFMFDKYMHKSENKVKIIGPKGIEKRIKDLFEVIFPGDFEKVNSGINIEYFEFDSKTRTKIDDIEVQIFLVEHGKIELALGYVIEKENKKIGFSGDSNKCKSIDEIVRISDISVLDMNRPAKGGNGHMGLDDIKEICHQYKNKKVIATHMHDITREKALEESIGNLIVPKINFEINI